MLKYLFQGDATSVGESDKGKRAKDKTRAVLGGPQQETLEDNVFIVLQLIQFCFNSFGLQVSSFPASNPRRAHLICPALACPC